MKNVILSLASLSFVVIIGAAVYEHLATVPKWTMAPPMSLTMFEGPYGIDSSTFWVPVHPVTLLLLIASLVLNWNTLRRKNLLVVLSVYALILISTFVYFVPELLALIKTPYSAHVDADLLSRAVLWERLSLVRLGILLPMAFILIHSLTKPLVKA